VGNYIKSHFFEESLNGEVYTNFLENIFPQRLENVSLDVNM